MLNRKLNQQEHDLILDAMIAIEHLLQITPKNSPLYQADTAAIADVNRLAKRLHNTLDKLLFESALKP